MAGRGDPKTSPRRIEIAERRKKATQMRQAGASYETIARTMGYKSASNAVQDVQRYLAETAQEATAEVRAMELARLDMLWQKAMAVLVRNHITVSNGKVISVDGKNLVDDGPTLAAIDRLLKIQERRAKLLGLDAPAKHEVVTIDAVEAEIAKLTAELAATTVATAD